MPSILMPQKDNSSKQMVTSLLPIAGSFFGPVGGAVGGLAATALNKSGNSQAQSVPESAMSRRGQQLAESPDQALARAKIALETAPKELQQAYGPTLDEALALSRKNRPQNQYGSV